MILNLPGHLVLRAIKEYGEWWEKATPEERAARHGWTMEHYHHVMDIVDATVEADKEMRKDQQ